MAERDLEGNEQSKWARGFPGLEPAYRIGRVPTKTDPGGNEKLFWRAWRQTEMELRGLQRRLGVARPNERLRRFPATVQKQ